MQTKEVVQESEYDEHGNIMKNTNAEFQPLGFAGGLYDSDTKFLRFGARDYDPTVGRWITKDPIGFAGGDTNLYAYVGGNPMSYNDPTGLARCKYSISTGSLSCSSNDGSQTFDLNAISGNKNFRNDPSKTGLTGGPVPIGRYDLTKTDGDPTSMDWFLDPGLMSRIGYRLGQNRGGFKLHLRPGGSEGCITSKGNSRDSLQNLNSLLINEAGSNYIEVGY